MSTSTPIENAFLLDGIVFNKALESDEKRKTEAYTYVKEIALDHVDYENPDFDEEDKINKTDEDGDYVYASFENFDQILYTSP
jgi:hypothetical protein